MRLTSKAQSNVAAPLTKTLIVLQGTSKAEILFNTVFRKDIFKAVKWNAIGNLEWYIKLFLWKAVNWTFGKYTEKYFQPFLAMINKFRQFYNDVFLFVQSTLNFRIHDKQVMISTCKLNFADVNLIQRLLL